MLESTTPFRPSPWIHQGREPFIGRERELEEVFEALTTTRKTSTLVILTGEAGIGKTALAATVADRARERELFAGGILEISCEQVRGSEHLFCRMLEALGVSAVEHHGDLQQRVRETWDAHHGAKLLLLDHLDPLIERMKESDEERKAIVKLLVDLERWPDLRTLITYRRPQALPFRGEIELASLPEEESLEVFLAYLEGRPKLAAALRRDFAAGADPLRRLLGYADGHPLALRLLARRLRHRRQKSAKLEAQFRRYFSRIFPDFPDVPANRAHMRELFVYQFVFFHVEPMERQLFGMLCLLPGGVWCGRQPERWIDWEKYLLTRRWKSLLASLHDQGLVECVNEASESSDSQKVYRLAPALADFSRAMYDFFKRQSQEEVGDEKYWEKVWVGFWGECLELWVTTFRQTIAPADHSGMLLQELLGDGAGNSLGDEVLAVFRGSQRNLIPVVEYLCGEGEGSELAAWFVQFSLAFLGASGQWRLARDLARRTVAALRHDEESASLLAPSLMRLGTIESKLGEPETAARRLAEAIEIFEKQGAGDLEHEGSRAAAHYQLGLAQRELESYDEALNALGTACDLWQRLAADHPRLFKPHLVDALREIGALHHHLGRHEEARDVFARAVDCAREIGEDSPQVAKSLNNLALLHGQLGDVEKAAQAQRETVDAYRRLAEENPAHEHELAAALGNLGGLERRLGELRSARELFEESVAIYERLAGSRPLAFEPHLANSLNNLATACYDLGELAPAEQLFEKALAIQRRLAGVSPEDFEAELARTLSNLGNVREALGSSGAAADALEEALAIRRRLAAKRPEAFEPELAATLSNLGAIRREASGLATARSLIEDALDIYRRLAETRPAAFEPDLAMALNNLAAVCSEQGDRNEALRLFDQALDIYRRLAQKRPAAFDPEVAMAYTNLGQLMADDDQVEMARSFFVKAIEIYMRLVRQDVSRYLAKLNVPLKKYVSLTPESDDDPMWQLWRGQEEIVKALEQDASDP